MGKDLVHCVCRTEAEHPLHGCLLVTITVQSPVTGMCPFKQVNVWRETSMPFARL